MHDKITAYFDEAANVLHAFSRSKDNITFVANLSNAIANTIMGGNKIISFGNGGSMCDAMHFAEELTGRFRTDRISLPAIAISDPSYISCVANDYGYDRVFSRYVEGIGKKGDLVIGLTTSGHSPNVNNAFKAAALMGIRSYVLSGKKGGDSMSLADYGVVVPSDESERIQEIHIKILHIAIDMAEQSLKQRGYM